MNAVEPTPIRTVDTLGRAIAARRKTLRMSQDELSSLSGITQANLSNIERGTAGGRLETYLRICSLIGIDLFAVSR